MEMRQVRIRESADQRCLLWQVWRETPGLVATEMSKTPKGSKGKSVKILEERESQ